MIPSQSPRAERPLRAARFSARSEASPMAASVRSMLSASAPQGLASRVFLARPREKRSTPSGSSTPPLRR